MKDHEKRELVDKLTAIAREYASTQQLRARIADVLLPALRREEDRHAHETDTAEGSVGDNRSQVQQPPKTQAFSRADAVSSDAPPHASGTGSSNEDAVVGHALQSELAVLTDTTEALSPVPERVDFEGWLECEQMLTATWSAERNCYDEFPAHLAFKAWQARAALAQRQHAPTTAWLVEWRFNGVQWLYLWARAPGGFSFTSDASKALRFARREDAEAALQWARDTDAARRPIGSLTRHGLALGEMLVTEHDWPALPAVPSAQRQQVPLIEWAVQRWKDEVANRPLINKNRRTLDDTWRQVIRFAGGDPYSLLGPSHDELLTDAPAFAAEPSAQAEPTSLDQEPELLVPCVLPGHEGEWMAENGKRYVLSKPKESIHTRINRRGAQELIDTMLETVRRNAYEEALADIQGGRWVLAEDVDRLAKELDACINGKGAAPHPKLVDVVSQVRSMNLGIGVPLLNAYLLYKQKQERGEIE